MDMYLPDEFYELRDDLPDWRDAPAGGESDHNVESREEGADPSWKSI